jgi:membrane-associated phospholipid phosphatase
MIIKVAAVNMFRKLFITSNPYEILGVKTDSTDVAILAAAIKKFSSLPYMEERPWETKWKGFVVFFIYIAVSYNM